MSFCLVFNLELVINGFILIGKSALTRCSFGLSLEMVSFGGHHEVNTLSQQSVSCIDCLELRHFKKQKIKSTFL